MFLNVPLRARAGENANEPKKKQFTHAQSGCKFTTRSIRKIAPTSAAKSAALPWFKEQPQAARTYSVLQVQMAWLLSWGREDLRKKKKSPLGFTNPKESPLHSGALCILKELPRSLLGVVGHWLNKGKWEKISQQLRFPARFRVLL